MKTESSVWARAALCSLAAALGASVHGAGLSSRNYVQEGLVAHFDAIENVGVGQPHDATATVWKDLKGSASLTLKSGAAWAERALDLSTTDSHKLANMPAFSTDNCTTEVSMNLAQGNPSGWRRIFTVDYEKEGAYNVYVNPNSCTPYLYIRGNGTRPTFGGLTWGTLGVACATNYCYTYQSPVGYGSGVQKDSLGKSAGYLLVPSCAWTLQGYGGGVIHGQYCAFRHYNRPLDQDELSRNALVDRLRFFSFALRGSGETAAWADVAWTQPIQATATAPATGFADYVTIANATVSVGAADTVELNGLSLEDGATLAIAEGGVVTVKQLFVEGEWVSRGVYTAASGNGKAVSWITGAGEVRVTGAYAKTLPKPVAGLGPLNYVQDGLIAQFDAVDNEGTGDHNPAATVWKDLAGSASVTLSGNATWIDRALDTGASQQTIKTMPSFYGDSVFTEVAVNILSHESGYPRLFYHSGGDAWYNVFHQNPATTEMHYYMGNQSTSRPSFNFSNGTMELGSDRTNMRTYVNGTASNTSGSYHVPHIFTASADWYLDRDGKLHSHFKSFRHYNRALTTAEIAHNRQIDIQRFESYLYTGDGSAVDWSAIAWLKPERGGAGDAPSAATNEYAVIANAAVRVAASGEAAVAGLSLERGATLEVAAGAAVDLKLLYVNGREVARGVYTADGRGSTTAASWVTGAGEVRVAGGLTRGVPSIAVADADGWHTFGLASGRYDQTWIIGEHPNWDNYIFPAGAKLRLKGYLLLDTVPDVFADYDTSALACVFVNGSRAYEADRPFIVPANAVFRFVPGSWVGHANSSNSVAFAAVSATKMAQATGDIVLGKSSQFQVRGDGMPNLTYNGLLTGEGALYTHSFGRQMRFTGGFALDGTCSDSWQAGSGVWFDTLAMTGTLAKVSLSNCDYQSGTNIDYCASYLMFGKDKSDATADHPLEVGTLNGNYARTKLDVPSGHLWRSGGHVIVWGSNTVHVGTLQNGIHAVASQKEQDCTNGFLHKGYYSGKGIGFLAVDNFASGTIFGSTNVALTIGAAAAGTAFDYTCQTSGVNALTLDITGGCNEATTLKATDLAMLPQRVSGFKGKVTLTDTGAKAYEMAVDFTAGPNGLYNPVGCNGSGTLVAAPAEGSINVTFPTEGVEPVKGKYALARFSAGGDLLKDWTVTLNGENVSEKRIGNHVYTVRRNDKGLCVGVDLPGLYIILR